MPPVTGVRSPDMEPSVRAAAGRRGRSIPSPDSEEPSAPWGTNDRLMAIITRSLPRPNAVTVDGMDDLGRVILEREAPEERHEAEPFEPLVQATIYLCYLLMLLAVLSVVAYEAARFAGG
jgi:hypothetical protein